jgi:hypothetical protein
MFTVFMALMLSVSGVFFAAQMLEDFRIKPVKKKIKAKNSQPDFEPYVVGVNKFLIPFDQWKANLEKSLDQMKTMHDPAPPYPEDYIYLEPLVSPSAQAEMNRRAQNKIKHEKSSHKENPFSGVFNSANDFDTDTSREDSYAYRYKKMLEREKHALEELNRQNAAISSKLDNLEKYKPERVVKGRKIIRDSKGNPVCTLRNSYRDAQRNQDWETYECYAHPSQIMKIPKPQHWPVGYSHDKTVLGKFKCQKCAKDTAPVQTGYQPGNNMILIRSIPHKDKNMMEQVYEDTNTNEMRVVWTALPPAAQPVQDDSYNNMLKMTKAELTYVAKQYDIEVKSRWTKAEIILAIQNTRKNEESKEKTIYTSIFY